MDERFGLLVEAWLDAAITAADQAELEGLLLESAAARQEFWRRAAFHGMLREAVKIADAPGAASAVLQPHGRPAGAAFSRLPGRMSVAVLLLVVGGTCLGSAVTALAFAYSGYATSPAAAVVVHREGFEQPPAPLEQHIPKQFDVWGGDDTEVVGSQILVAPCSGNRMLRFVAGQPPGAVYRGRGSEIWRLLDLDAVRAEVASREVHIEFSAQVNAQVGESGRHPRSGFDPLQFWLSVVATVTRPEELGSRWDEQFLAADADPASIAAAQIRECIDGDPATWERLSVSITVPAKARFLLVHCSAVLAADDRPAAERARYYVDDITLTAQPVIRSAAGGSVSARPGGGP